MITPDPEAERQKEILKEALKEWMDEKFALLGKWAFSAFGVALIGALTYFILWTNGWKPL
jgi:hypothetical protein